MLHDKRRCNCLCFFKLSDLQSIQIRLLKFPYPFLSSQQKNFKNFITQGTNPGVAVGLSNGYKWRQKRDQLKTDITFNPSRVRGQKIYIKKGVTGHVVTCGGLRYSKTKNSFIWSPDFDSKRFPPKSIHFNGFIFLRKRGRIMDNNKFNVYLVIKFQLQTVKFNFTISGHTLIPVKFSFSL